MRERKKEEVVVHYSPPPSNLNNLYTGAPIASPFVAMQSSSHPLRNHTNHECSSLLLSYKPKLTNALRPLSRQVKLGFKVAWPWPENVKFQFWPSFNELQQREVTYATLELRRMLFERFRGGSCLQEAACATCRVQNPPFLLLFMNHLRLMPFLAFPMHFSIPKALKCASKHIKVPNGMKLYKFYSIQG
ncbi:hypothetical protein PIB30_054234 [Stylosanthes scabra]|uniref:Uncharacterized protein n=1 Tax=Stylosanthes scabra TaxID=79078 RepID=A0ABU6XGH8_9FABA|nr:hypothetical protein [Stylosanthes scabra]